MEDEKKDSPDNPPKQAAKKALAIRYNGSLTVCACGKYGIFRKGIAHRLREEGYVPRKGDPDMTEEQARDLVEEQAEQYDAIVRDKRGNPVFDSDGLPKLETTKTYLYEIVEIDLEGGDSIG